MKLLELPIFEQINALLTQERQNCHVESKIESYSCKMVADDKKLLKELSHGKAIPDLFPFYSMYNHGESYENMWR